MVIKTDPEEVKGIIRTYLCKVAHFYESPGKALAVMNANLGTICPQEYRETTQLIIMKRFYEEQREAYHRRVKAKVPHTVSLLEIEFENPSESLNRAQSKRYLALDEIAEDLN